MDKLERKIKRWKFLNEIYNRGVESVGSQIERNANDIMLMRIELELKKRKELRDSKINSVLSDKI
jgi:hypothetical protein